MLDGPGIRPRVSPLLCTRSLGELMQTEGKDGITHGLTVYSQHYIWSNSDSSLELHVLKLHAQITNYMSNRHLTFKCPEETLVPPPLVRIYQNINNSYI